MTATLCPELVGRTAERARLLGVVSGAGQAHGRAAAVVGEAGVGKSRLVREALAAARQAGAAVAVGRCVEGPVAVALRPLTEAVTGLVRARTTPATRALSPYRSVLGRLAPELLDDAPLPPPADPDPVHLGEGLLRLLSVHGAGRGALLVVEDLQDADPLSLAVVEYVVDVLAGSALAVSLLVTTRPEPSPGRDLVEALVRRRSAEQVVLGPLPPTSMEQLVRLCDPDLPEHVVQVVVGRAGGIPFLAEELLVAAADPAGRVDPRRVQEVVPLSLLDAVLRRTAALDADVLQLLRLAAVVGRSAPPELLADATGRSVAEVTAALQPARDTQLLAADQACTFRHALTRDAVLASVLPAERTALAAGLLPAARRQNLDPAVLARLAESADDAAQASRAWLAVAQDALREGLPTTAKRTLLRAERQAGRAGDETLRTTVRLRRLTALALAGEASTVLELAEELQDLPGLDAAVRDEIHLHAARAALDAGRLARAEAELAACTHPHAAVSSLGALVALAEGRLEVAEERARTLVERDTAAPAAVCEAWEVLGRLRRPRDLPAAQAAFAAAHRTAVAARLPLWEARALHELGTVQMFLTGHADRLLDAHAAALSLGASGTVTVLDVQIASCLALALEPAAALARAEAAAVAARRAGARPLVAAAAVVTAQAHSYAGRWDEAERAAAHARELSDEDPETLALLAGLADGLGGLLAEDRERARSGFEAMAAQQHRAPRLPPMPSLSLRVLLAAVEDAPWQAEARTEAEASGIATVPYNALLLSYAAAVALGRDGDGDAAAEVLRAADAELAAVGPAPAVQHLAHLGRRLVAEAALRDGWGEPVGWLRAALADFDERAPAVADACRRLLRVAGAPAPRRQPGASRPSAVRAAGITAREYDVLLLVATGASNREVAERLHLSPRTAETHVARLLSKTGCSGRAELAAWAGAAGADIGSAHREGQ